MRNQIYITNMARVIREKVKKGIYTSEKGQEKIIILLTNNS